MNFKKIDFFVLQPRFWPTWIGVFFFYLLSKLPFVFSLKIGKFMGKLLYRYHHYLRHIVEVNLKMCFPQQNEIARTRLAKNNFAELGMGLIETAYSIWRSSEKLQKYFTVQGFENLNTALEKNKGVILLFAHFTPLEAVGKIIPYLTKASCYALYTPLRNEVINKLIVHSREKHLKKVFVRNNMRAVIKSLQKNGVVYYGMDGDFGRKKSIFIPFFGVEAATLTALRRLIKISGATIIPVHFSRINKTPNYEIKIEKALENFPTDDERADLTQLNQIFEEMIIQNPEQYFWFHFRFKTRPQGESPVYDITKFPRLGR